MKSAAGVAGDHMMIPNHVAESAFGTAAAGRVLASVQQWVLTGNFEVNQNCLLLGI